MDFKYVSEFEWTWIQSPFWRTVSSAVCLIVMYCLWSCSGDLHHQNYPHTVFSRSEWASDLLLATMNKRLANTMRHQFLFHSYFHAFFSVSFKWPKKYISFNFYIVPRSEQVVRPEDKQYLTLYQGEVGGWSLRLVIKTLGNPSSPMSQHRKQRMCYTSDAANLARWNEADRIGN